MTHSKAHILKDCVVCLLGILAWNLLNSVLTMPVLSTFMSTGIYSSNFILKHEVIYNLAVALPFIISSSIAAMLVGIFIALFFTTNRWLFGLAIIVLGQLPYTITSSYQISGVLLITKVAFSCSMGFLLYFLGTYLGCYLKQLTGRVLKLTNRL
jgi:hypothetical protein